MEELRNYMDMIEQLQVPQLLKLEWYEHDLIWERHMWPGASSTQVDFLSQIKQIVGNGECHVIDIRYPQEAAEVIFQNWFDRYTNSDRYENDEFVYKSEQGIHFTGRCSDLLKSHPTIVELNYKELGKNFRECGADIFVATLKAGYFVEQIIKRGVSVLDHCWDLPGCEDDEKWLSAVLHSKDLLWCPLTILPRLSRRLRSMEAVVGAIFQRAATELNPFLNGMKTEEWAAQESVKEAWKSVPAEVVAQWSTHDGSPNILAADPRLCMLIPGCIEPEKCRTFPEKGAVAFRLFCTERWSDTVPKAWKVSWARCCFPTLGAGIFQTANWLSMSWEDRKYILNRSLSSLNDIIDIAETFNHYMMARHSDVWKMMWQLDLVVKELAKNDESEYMYPELHALWEYNIAALGNVVSSVIYFQPLLLGIKFCEDYISDELVLHFARTDASRLKHIRFPPKIQTSPDIWRARRHDSRERYLAEEVMLVVGSQNWDSLPGWLQEASEWKHLTCPMCLGLPVCALPTDEVRRCRNGHLLCCVCHKILSNAPKPQRKCPVCRDSGGWYVDHYASENLRRIA